MNIVLSLDIGTSKIAAIAFDGDSQKSIAVVGEANAATVGGLPPGTHEQDPEEIYETCLRLLRTLIASGGFDPAQVGTIALSGQMHGVVLVDAALDPVTNLITWCDQRASTLTGSIEKSTWPAGRTGCFLHPGYGGATLAVLAKGGAIPPGATALAIADHVAARLCGIAATGPTHAASWGIMDLAGGRWDPEAIDRLGIPPSVLPEIRPDLGELGRLRVELGLPGEVTVRVPVGDNQASFIGTCGLGNDALLLNLGTGGQVSFPSAELSRHADLETRPMPFGGYLLVGSSLCGGRAYALLEGFFRQTLRDFAGLEPTDDELYASMNRVAADSGIELEVDTRLAGTRMTPSVRGSIEGIDIGNLNPGSLCRGFIHGMVRELTDMVPREAIGKFRTVLVSGNAIRRNSLARDFVSRELGLACALAENREEAATGAALAAAWAANLR
jgi:sedoheptulokinase